MMRVMMIVQYIWEEEDGDKDKNFTLGNPEGVRIKIKDFNLIEK